MSERSTVVDYQSATSDKCCLMLLTIQRNVRRIQCTLLLKVTVHPH